MKDEAILRATEARLLGFVAAVILLACATFICGGTCAAWQWWLPLAVATFWGFRRHRASAMLFLAIIIAMWLLTPFGIDDCRNSDVRQYHLPMVRLLELGWNPVTDPTATGICSALNVDIWGARPYHIAYCPKPAAVFCAVAQFFTQDPWSVFFPFWFIGFAAVSVTLFRVFREYHLAISCAGIAFLLYFLFPVLTYSVDVLMFVASAGLLVTLYADFRDRRISFVPILGYAFLLANFKLPGAVVSAVLLMLFASVKIFQSHYDHKVVLRFLGAAVLLAGLSFIASINPYYTSFRDTGHPLYSFKTVDPEKFPLRDIAGDFHIANDDAKMMGWFGSMANAYLSPRLVRAYYNHKLGRSDFKPHRRPWDYCTHDKMIRCSPLSTQERAILLLTFALMMALPGLRVLAGGLVAATLAFPHEMAGFVRYYQWLPAASGVTAVVLLATVAKWKPRLSRFACNFALVIGGCWLVLFGNRCLSSVARDAQEIAQRPHTQKSSILRQSMEPIDPEVIEWWRTLGISDKASSLNLILLNKLLGCEHDYRALWMVWDEEPSLEMTKFGWWDSPKTYPPTAPTKFGRLIKRLGNVRVLYDNYSERLGRLVRCDRK